MREGRTLASTLEPLPGPATIPALLLENAERFADRPVYAERRGAGLAAVTWAELLADVAALGAFLRGRGVDRGDRVVVVSRNCGAMLTAELAAMSIGAIHVPLFPGYSAEQTSDLIEHAGASHLCLADRAQIAKLRPNDRIRWIVLFEEIAPEQRREAAPWYRGEAIGLREILGDRRGGPSGISAAEEIARSSEGIEPRDPALMMYTSGTAGELKGVLLCHDNILSQQRAMRRIWGLDETDRFLSYLPWHHSFGGIFEKYNALYNAAPLSIDDSLGKEIPTLLRNWKEVRPTVYFSVPAVYLELFNHIQAHPKDEEAIFHRELRFVFTAAAPLPGHISDFLAARGIPVVEGWGLTETSPCCTVTDFHEPRTEPGMVGYPIPGVKIRLEEDGEILIQGSNVMLGYFKNEEATRRALPGDGWFRTGDLGELSGRGLKLVARKDRIFKLLNGERVTPTPIEVRLAAMSRYIRHVVVAGSGRDRVVALIFLNTTLIESEFGADEGRAAGSVQASLADAVRKLNGTHPVRYERIQAFAVIDHSLTVERGELTPSMKLRVANVLRNHEEYLEAIYDPLRDCDCRLLRKVLRLAPDDRSCPRGTGLTLDRCVECLSPPGAGRGDR